MRVKSFLIIDSEIVQMEQMSVHVGLPVIPRDSSVLRMVGKIDCLDIYVGVHKTLVRHKPSIRKKVRERSMW